MDKVVGGPGIFDAHVLGVPLDFFASAVGDVAEVVGFGQKTGVFEIGAAGLAIFTAGDPFFVMAR